MQSSPITPDLAQHVTYPFSPWQVSDVLFNNVQSAPSSQPYRKYEVLGTDPEAKFVVEYFCKSAPAKFGIRRIWVIHNPDQTALFESSVKTIDNEAKQPFYAPNWRKEPHADERDPVHKRWEEMAKIFSPVQIAGKERVDRCDSAKVLPLWHGAGADKCNSICSTGFTSLGKHHFSDVSAPKGQFASTDRGYFGSGIYFTDSADYASMYGSGNILMTWVTMREPYPVYSDLADSKQCTDMKTLGGEEHFQNYNAHFIPVKHVTGLEHYPCAQGQAPVWDEFVVFNKDQTLPRFWVELGINLPKNPFINLIHVVQQGALQTAPQVSSNGPSAVWGELPFFGRAFLKKVAELPSSEEFSFDRGLRKEDFEVLQRHAKKGEAEAEHLLGICYQRGMGVEMDLEEMVDNYGNAAEKGHLTAQCRLGWCYSLGKGVPEDKKEAAKWYRKAAEQRSAMAQNALGGCYESGEGVEKSLEEAAKWYRRAADQGFAPAQYNLALRYENGEGVEQSLEEAAKWYRRAADQGFAPAQYDLALRYRHGEGVEKSLEEAAKWFRKAAEQGRAWAQYNLGLCYRDGEGVEESLEEAAKWFRKAAEQGNAWTQYNLGVCYRGGEGVEKSLEEAAKWFRKAAEQKNADAQYNLGSCYYDGEGVEKSLEEAAKWFRKAAEQGYANSQYNLGVCYYNGEGVPEDKKEAAKWYRKAAEQGNAAAIGVLKTLKA